MSWLEWVPSLLLHAVPVRHSEEADPWITIGLTTLGVFSAILAGLIIGNRARRTPTGRKAALGFAAGALLFLFFDLLKEAASLGQGLVTQPILQAGLVLSFVLGLLAFAAVPAEREARVAWAWALLVAAHGAGEAWIVGTEAFTALVTEPTQAASFLLHKVAEGFTIPLVAGVALSTRQIGGMAAALAAIALVGAVGGFVLGPGLAPLAFFAIGAGGAAFAILRLAKQSTLTFAYAAWVALGLVFIYLAGVLHEF